MTRDREERAPCEDVAERVALGEPLGDLERHAASCGECRSITDTAGKLAVSHRDVDPGLGFSARMTIGAQQRLAVRKRRRVAASLAGVTVAGALGVFVVTRSPKDPVDSTIGPSLELPRLDEPQPIAEDDAKMLIELADTRRARRASAPWGRIEKSLRPYRKLVLNVRPHEVPVMYVPAASTPAPTETDTDTEDTP